jgi:hypothetical protein
LGDGFDHSYVCVSVNGVKVLLKDKTGYIPLLIKPELMRIAVYRCFSPHDRFNTTDQTSHKVTNSLYKDGQFFVIKKIPARVNPETREQYFSPHTVERL